MIKGLAVAPSCVYAAPAGRAILILRWVAGILREHLRPPTKKKPKKSTAETGTPPLVTPSPLLVLCAWWHHSRSLVASFQVTGGIIPGHLPVHIGSAHDHKCAACVERWASSLLVPHDGCLPWLSCLICRGGCVQHIV